MKLHASILCEEITYYLPDVEKCDRHHRFINNQSVLSSINDLPSEDNLSQEQFVDFIDDGGAKPVFREMSCSDFFYCNGTGLSRRCKDGSKGVDSIRNHQ